MIEPLPTSPTLPSCIHWILHPGLGAEQPRPWTLGNFYCDVRVAPVLSSWTCDHMDPSEALITKMCKVEKCDEEEVERWRQTRLTVDNLVGWVESLLQSKTIL